MFDLTITHEVNELLKQVFKERKVDIEFKNGWEII